MIAAEAKAIENAIYSDVIALGITNDKRQRVKIAVLVAKSIKDATKDGVYQHVINNLNNRLD